MNGACYITFIGDVTASGAASKAWSILTPLVDASELFGKRRTEVVTGGICWAAGNIVEIRLGGGSGLYIAGIV
ncbi:hypothetical protein E2C01_097476 [Portunus trituberculatus]|uniref:Uncharacterized protein n=1 Tax=Portunus trituberculatus TaxID=210409 RepID=A0A5B7K4X5_PORTR|nr:hypothetical protein [Portunus trituberculatus]